ncbi:hypothetical protein GC163_02545 [bacterium]|nr:hypothetical protein [bacterium]
MMLLTMLAWCSAMLFAAPLFAAVDCHACCSEQRQQVQPATCPHCPIHESGSVDAVCHSPAAADDDCGTKCPRCERSRPVPYDRSASTEITMPSVVLMAWLPVDVISLNNFSQSAEGQVTAGITPHSRSACVLYHRWLE